MLATSYLLLLPAIPQVTSDHSIMYQVGGGRGRVQNQDYLGKDRFYTAIWKPGGMEINFRKVYCSDVIPLSPTQKATTFFFKQLK